MGSVRGSWAFIEVACSAGCGGTVKVTAFLNPRKSRPTIRKGETTVCSACRKAAEAEARIS